MANESTNDDVVVHEASSTDVEKPVEFEPPKSVQAQQEAAPTYEKNSPEDPAVAQWIKGAKMLGYEERLQEGESMYDLYRSLHNLGSAEPEQIADEPSEAVVPSTEEAATEDSNDVVEIGDSPEEAESSEAEEPFVNRVSKEAWDEMTQQAFQSGTIGDEHRDLVKKSWGVDDEVIDTYLEGLKAKQRQHFSTAAEVVGGEAELKAVLNWAAGSFSAEEKKSMNEALRGSQRDLVLKGLAADYRKANPVKEAKKSEPSMDKSASKAVAATGVTAFKNYNEMMAYIRDPRYSTDSAYRNMVQDRINKSHGL